MTKVILTRHGSVEGIDPDRFRGRAEIPLLLQLLDQPISAYWRLAQSPCAINKIDITGRHVRIEQINDTSHLRDV